LDIWAGVAMVGVATQGVDLSISCRVSSVGSSSLNTVSCVGVGTTGVSTLAVGLPALRFMASRSFSLCSFEFCFGVATIDVATHFVGFPASCLVTSVFSGTLNIQSWVSFAMLGVGLWGSCRITPQISPWFDFEFKLGFATIGDATLSIGSITSWHPVADLLFFGVLCRRRCVVVATLVVSLPASYHMASRGYPTLFYIFRRWDGRRRDARRLFANVLSCGILRLVSASRRLSSRLLSWVCNCHVACHP
jgi:hypothetical protein